MLIFRMECYREVTKVLDLLYHQSQSSPYLPRVPLTPGPPPPQPTELLPTTEYIAKVSTQNMIFNIKLVYLYILCNYISCTFLIIHFD